MHISSDQEHTQLSDVVSSYCSCLNMRTLYKLGLAWSLLAIQVGSSLKPLSYTRWSDSHTHTHTNTYVLFHSNFDCAAVTLIAGGLVHKLVYTWSNCWPLDCKWGHEHVECDTAVTIATKKCHQKSKSNKDHYMNILKDCGEESFWLK